MQAEEGMADTFTQDREAMADTFMQGQELPKDYGHEKEDEVDIVGEPLCADDLTHQANAQKKRHNAFRRRHTQRMRTSSFANVERILDKIPRSVSNKKDQPFG